MGHGEHFVFVREKVAIVRSALVIEYGYLPVESTNGTIYIDFSQLHAGVINEVAGGKVIASVYHNVVLADDPGGIFCGETIGVSIDLYGAVQGFETFFGLDGFGHTYFGFAIEYLALQVADAYHVIVHQSDGAYSGACQVLKSCEIDFNNPPAKAQEIISAGDVPLGTQGNLFGITGGEGTGKSNYVAAIVAGCICPAGADVDTLGIQITANGKHKAVLLYDTEQSEVQLFKNVSNLLARAKQPDKPDELKAFCLTGMSRKERLNAIVQSMDKFYYQYGGIQLVVIDGIADLVKSANDEAESVAVIDELYRLAGIYNTCILCVLHFVPNGLKLRGHLGSELQRKAATILSIEKDEEPTQSVVKALKVRDGSPLDVPLMLFAWDKKAGMHVYKGEKPREEKEKRKERELVGVARDIFGRQTHITYIDLCEQLQQVLDVKERTAKSYIRFMREREIIIKDPVNQSYFMIGLI